MHVQRAADVLSSTAQKHGGWEGSVFVLPSLLRTDMSSYYRVFEDGASYPTTMLSIHRADLKRDTCYVHWVIFPSIETSSL